MTDKEKWLELLKQYFDFEKEDIIDYGDSIYISPSENQLGRNNNNIIGDHWAEIEIFFNKEGKFKSIEIIGN